jgi:plasmid maintenance system antidote protein VapI
VSAAVDETLRKLCVGVSNDTIDCAARIAKMYGASDEVVAAILKLKRDEKEAA